MESFPPGIVATRPPRSRPPSRAYGRRGWGLATKTIAIPTLIASLAVVVASVLWLRYQDVSLTEASFNGLDAQASVASLGITEFVEEALRDARAIAATLPPNSLAPDQFGVIQSHLQRMHAIFDKFEDGITLLDGEGRLVADYPPHPEFRGESFADHEYFQRTLFKRRQIISQAFKSVRTGNLVLAITSPLMDSTGRITAVVVCSLDLLSREVLGGYRDSRFGRTGSLYVIDESLRLLLHPEDDWLLTVIEGGESQILEAAVMGFEGTAEVVNSRGVPVLMAVRAVPKTNWFVVVQVPQAEAYAPFFSVRKKIVLTSSAALVLVIIFGTAAVRRVTRPLTQLEEVAHRISTELEDAKITGAYTIDDRSLDGLRSIRSGDEIGQLASAFLRLAARLKHTLGSLQDAAEDWERTFNSVHEAVLALDLEGRIVRMNQVAQNWFRLSVRKARGQLVQSVVIGSATAPPDWPKMSPLAETQRVRWVQELERPRGTFEFSYTSIIHEGAIAGAVMVIDDISERVRSEARIREMAFFDLLTGLPNRFLLQDRLRQALASAGRNQKLAAVMFVDLDRFKDINDQFGHDVGDQALKQVVESITSCVRDNDTVSRIGGDEFVVVLQDLDDAAEPGRVAERILAAQKAPFTIGNRELVLSSSIGIAVFPGDGRDAETLLKKADSAMYRAKDEGRAGYRYSATS